MQRSELGAGNRRKADVQRSPFLRRSILSLSSQTPIAAYITFFTGASFLYFIWADRQWLICHAEQGWRLLRRALLPYCMVLAGTLTSYSLLQAHIVISAAKGKEWSPRIANFVTWSLFALIPLYTIAVIVSGSASLLLTSTELTLSISQVLTVRLQLA